MTTLQQRLATELASLDEELMVNMEPPPESFRTNSCCKDHDEEMEKKLVETTTPPTQNNNYYCETERSVPVEEKVSEVAIVDTTTAALIDQFWKANAGSGGIITKRSRKNGIRKGSGTTNALSTKEGTVMVEEVEEEEQEEKETQQKDASSNTKQRENVDRKTDRSLCAATASALTSKRTIRASKEDILNGLAANRERRQRQNLHRQIQQRFQQRGLLSGQGHIKEQHPQSSSARSDHCSQRSQSSNAGAMVDVSLTVSFDHERHSFPCNTRTGEELPGGSDHSTRTNSNSHSKSRRSKECTERRCDTSKERLDTATTLTASFITTTSSKEAFATDITAFSSFPDAGSSIARRPSTDLKRMSTERRTVRRYKSDDYLSMAESTKRTDSLVISSTPASNSRGMTRRQCRATCTRTSRTMSDDSRNSHASADIALEIEQEEEKSTSSVDISASLRSSRRRDESAMNQPTFRIKEGSVDDVSADFSAVEGRKPKPGSSSSSVPTMEINRPADSASSMSEILPLETTIPEIPAGINSISTDNGTTTNGVSRSRRGRRRSETQQQILNQQNKEVDPSKRQSAPSRRGKSPGRQQRGKSPMRSLGGENNKARTRRRGGVKPSSSEVAIAKVDDDKLFERPRTLMTASDDTGQTSPHGASEPDISTNETLSKYSTYKLDQYEVIDGPVKEDEENAASESIELEKDENEKKQAASTLVVEGKPTPSSLFQNFLGRGKVKATDDREEWNDKQEDPAKEDICSTSEEMVNEDKTTTNPVSGSRFKNILGGRNGRNKETQKNDTSGGAENPDLQESSLVIYPVDNVQTDDDKDKEAKKSSLTKSKVKGLLARTNGSSTDKEPKPNSTDSDQVTEPVPTVANEEEKKRLAWKGLRGGLDFASRLKMTQEDKKPVAEVRESNEEEESEIEGEISTKGNEALEFYSDSISTEQARLQAKKKKTGKWNFAAKLKLNLQQEQKLKSENELRKKNEEDEKRPADYGLMNSVSSFLEEDLKDLIESALTKDPERPLILTSPNESPKMDRRMIMANVQGKSTKFDFSNHAEISSIEMRKNKEDVAVESCDSRSSFDPEDIDLTVEPKNPGLSTRRCDAFSLLSSSSSSNPPERRTVFANNLLREPSRRFDFQTKPSGISLKTKISIVEGDKIEGASRETEKGEEKDKELDCVLKNESIRQEFKPIEMELLEVVQRKNTKKRYNERKSEDRTIGGEESDVAFCKGGDITGTTNNHTKNTKEENAFLKKGIDNAMVNYPKLSTKECLQLVFGEEGAPLVLIHTLLEGKSDEGVENDDNEDHVFLRLKSTGTLVETGNLGRSEESARSPSPTFFSSSSSAYNRMVRELSESQKRIRQSQETVRIMEKELQSKQRRLAEIGRNQRHRRSPNQQSDVYV
jgi:hypothetical protein